MLLGGRGCWAIYFIWLANPGLLGLSTEVQQGRVPFSPASAWAGRPVLGCPSPWLPPFIFLRTKPSSEWSSKRLALLSRAFWLYSWGTLRILWQKLMEEPLAQLGYPTAEPAAFSPHGFTALECRHQGMMDWKAIQLRNQFNRQLAAASCFKLNN